MITKKGQSSFEYVTIYGWAFLIIVSTIGVLYSTGFLDFQFAVPDTCVFYGQIVCDEYAVTENGIVIGILNTFGVNLQLDSANFTNRQLGVSCGSVDFRETPQGVSNSSWPRSAKRFVVLDDCEPSELFLRGERLSGELQVTFYRQSTCDAPDIGECKHTSFGLLETIVG